jgi:hypothetical protein
MLGGCDLSRFQPRRMTPQELEILKAISCTEVKTFLPAGRSPGQAQTFDDLVERLQGMQRLRWIELEVAEHPGQVGKYRRKYIAAVARCTDHGLASRQPGHRFLPHEDVALGHAGIHRSHTASGSRVRWPLR